MRFEVVCRVKALRKAVDILIRKSGYQINMNMNVSAFDKPLYIIIQPVNIRMAVYGFQRLLVIALQPDFVDYSGASKAALSSRRREYPRNSK